MSFAVFITPCGPLKTELLSWKEKIRKEYINQPYLNHPPHMTLINTEVISVETALNTIQKFDNSIKSFPISVKTTDVFWNDTATNGHTLFFKVEYDKTLFEIQKSLANLIRPIKKKIRPPKNLTDNKLLLDSFEKYGFPFVGDHWIPHFTVASVLKEKTEPVIKSFLSNSKKYNFMVRELSLWCVEHDQHTQLGIVKLQ